MLNKREVQKERLYNAGLDYRLTKLILEHCINSRPYHSSLAAGCATCRDRHDTSLEHYIMRKAVQKIDTSNGIKTKSGMTE